MRYSSQILSLEFLLADFMIARPHGSIETQTGYDVCIKGMKTFRLTVFLRWTQRQAPPKLQLQGRNTIGSLSFSGHGGPGKKRTNEPQTLATCVNQIRCVRFTVAFEISCSKMAKHALTVQGHGAWEVVGALLGLQCSVRTSLHSSAEDGAAVGVSS